MIIRAQVTLAVKYNPGLIETEDITLYLGPLPLSYVLCLPPLLVENLPEYVL